MNVYQTRPIVKGLDRATAKLRGDTIYNVKYNLDIKISADENEFKGHNKITFDLKNNNQNVTIDFQEGAVNSILLNNEIIPIIYNNYFITLPSAFLKVGSNTVTIDYTHSYSNQGFGLHRFKDPEDGLTYVYTHFEPYNANQLFPCFDQPDLKATFILNVEAPKNWTVISSTREVDVIEKNNLINWSFPESPKMSTYLFSLHAGPYHQWRAQSGDVELRLFSRESLSKFVRSDEWLNVTKQGLSFYQKYFNYPYPFKKYDQVVVPEFNMGAMENVAAVTFSEKYVKRGEPTKVDREHLTNILLHEMAHQWFGDLVTMNWWNDLWLNESFATVMATMALNKATEFKKSWETFYSDDKNWGYTEDQYETTHPIETPVGNTDQAFANFDGITYGKGAAVLKQLFYFIGPESTKKGLHNYFIKHQFSNATLKDFFAALEEASGKNLKNWIQEWIRTAGLNTVKIDYLCDKGKIKNFRFLQSAPANYPTLRTHSTEVGFYNVNKKKIKLTHTEKVTYQERITNAPQFDGITCPDLVITNLHDYDYVKTKFDAKSLETVQKYISKLPDSFLRIISWMTLWEMVRDADLDVQTYADIVLNNLGAETDPNILDKVLDTVHGSKWADASVLFYYPKNDAEYAKAYTKLLSRFETFFWQNFKKSKPSSDTQKIWFDSFAKIATTLSAQSNLIALLDNRISVKGFNFDQDRRWSAIKQLNRVNPEIGQKYLDLEKMKDPSSEGILAAIAAKAVQPTATVKNEWYNNILNSNKLSLNQIQEAMLNLFPYDQIELRKSFFDQFFKDLNTANNKSNDFQDVFVQMYPALCSQESLHLATRYLNNGENLSPVLTKNVKIHYTEDQICVKARELAKEKLKTLL